MSLVNDMLNDLDRRRSPQGAAPEALEWMVGQTPVRRRSRSLPLLALTFIVALAALGYYLWGPLTGYGAAAADRLLVTTRTTEKATQATAATSLAAGEKPAISDLQSSDDSAVIAATSAASTAPLRIDNNGAQLLATATKGPGVSPAATDGPLPVVIKVPTVDSAPAANPVKTIFSPSPSQRDQGVARRGRALIRSGANADAEVLLRQQLQQQPDSSASATLLASLLLSQKHYDQVTSLLAQQRAVNPQHIGLLQLEARLLMATARAEQAQQLLLSQQPPVAEYPAYYELLALAARQYQDFELAQHSYQQLLASDPGRGDWWVGLAVVLDEQALPQQALQAYSRGLRTQRIGADLASYARQRVMSISRANR
ncbi:MAG: tetratricopeptide (TPR) repeat protein [Paraglaciecola psychrophila]|jgi:tetratricopeptide (TPR) repeat protein